MDRVSKLTQHLIAPSATTGAQLQKNNTAGDPNAECWYEVLNDGIALITLNRPRNLNALTGSMQYAYLGNLKKAAADPNVKVIVVTGNGRGFCAGAEMKLLQGISGDKAQESEKREQKKNMDGDGESLSWWASLSIPKPIIAAVNGPCAGLGLVLAAMTDIRFSTKSAKFTTAFAKRGLVAEHGISFILPKIVGISNAMDMMLSSRVILGDEAQEMGFVNKVFDSQEELLSYTMQYAKDMATLCSPASLAEMKTQLVRDIINKDAEDAGIYSQRLMKKSFRHPDMKEGVSSYVERRTPNFKGLAAGRIKDQ